jgi:hypothetical protein
MACTRAQPVGARPNSCQAIVGQLVGLAIAAAEQVDQRRLRQVLDRRLLRPGRHDVGQAAVVDHTVGVGDAAGRRDDPAAPVAEQVAVGGDRHRRVGDAVVGHQDVRHPRIVDVEHEDHRRRLREHLPRALRSSFGAAP